MKDRAAVLSRSCGRRWSSMERPNALGNVSIPNYLIIDALMTPTESYCLQQTSKNYMSRTTRLRPQTIDLTDIAVTNITRIHKSWLGLWLSWAALRHEYVDFAQTRPTHLLACASKQHKPSLTTTSLFVRELARSHPTTISAWELNPTS